MSSSTLEIIGICLTILSIVYEFFAMFYRRPDDGPVSIAQVIIALISRIVYVCSGRWIAFPPERKFRERYQQRIIAKSSLTLGRKSTLRIREYIGRK